MLQLRTLQLLLPFTNTAAERNLFVVCETGTLVVSNHQGSQEPWVVYTIASNPHSISDFFVLGRNCPVSSPCCIICCCYNVCSCNVRVFLCVCVCFFLIFPSKPFLFFFLFLFGWLFVFGLVFVVVVVVCFLFVFLLRSGFCVCS